MWFKKTHEFSFCTSSFYGWVLVLLLVSLARCIVSPGMFDLGFSGGQREALGRVGAHESGLFLISYLGRSGHRLGAGADC